MDEPIEDAYFKWLGVKVADLQPRVAEKWEILRELHTTEFAWIVVGDDHRAFDGIELRTYFCNEVGIQTDPMWMHMGCSMLEMLIALAQRAEFQTDIPARDWFWEFIHNLNIQSYDEYEIADLLHIFIWRLYDHNGEGGLFPLREPTRDQKRIQIWYQFCDYLAEKHQL